MESKMLSARLAWHVDAIKKARAGGVTWDQLGELFGTTGKYLSAAFKVAQGGKYTAEEQLPLPVTRPTTTPQQVERERDIKRVLPRVGGQNDGLTLTASQRVLANIPKIGE